MEKIANNKVRAKSLDMFKLGNKNCGNNISELFKQLKEQQNKEYTEGISFTSTFSQFPKQNHHHPAIYENIPQKVKKVAVPPNFKLAKDSN